MKKYVIYRIIRIVPTLFLMSIIVFITIRSIPGDPVRIILGESEATPEQIEQLRHRLGLDKPVFIQYITWINMILHGDFGRSLITRERVLPEALIRLAATFELTISSMLFASTFGLIAGTLAAVKQRTKYDYSIMGAALMGISTPVFWSGLIMIYIFSIYFGWFPISGRISYNANLQVITGLYLVDSIITRNIKALISVIKHIILPSVTLGSFSLAIITRLTRSSMLEILRQDYITMARSKGVAEWRIISIHALRNAIIPVITIIGLSTGSLLGGAILTETVFSYPGLGRHLIQAILNKNYPVVQARARLLVKIAQYSFLNLTQLSNISTNTGG